MGLKRRKGLRVGSHEVQSFASSSAEALGGEDGGFAKQTLKLGSNILGQRRNLFYKAPEWKSWVCFKKSEQLLVVSKDKV